MLPSTPLDCRGFFLSSLLAGLLACTRLTWVPPLPNIKRKLCWCQLYTGQYKDTRCWKQIEPLQKWLNETIFSVCMMKERIIIWCDIHSCAGIIKVSWMKGNTLLHNSHRPVVKKTERNHIVEWYNLRFSVGKRTISLGYPGNSSARTFEKLQ